MPENETGFDLSLLPEIDKCHLSILQLKDDIRVFKKRMRLLKKLQGKKEKIVLAIEQLTFTEEGKDA